jgi:hypothetical protein
MTDEQLQDAVRTVLETAASEAESLMEVNNDPFDEINSKEQAIWQGVLAELGDPRVIEATGQPPLAVWLLVIEGDGDTIVSVHGTEERAMAAGAAEAEADPGWETAGHGTWIHSEGSQMDVSESALR